MSNISPSRVDVPLRCVPDVPSGHPHAAAVLRLPTDRPDPRVIHGGDGEETPAFVYPQQIPVMYSQVPGYGGYGDGVSAVPVVFPSYGMNVPMQESSYFYGQAPSSQERAMPPESGGALGR